MAIHQLFAHLNTKKVSAIASVILLVTACGGSDSSTSPPAPTPNVAPTVSAGSDLSALENTEVTLTGSASDADGSISEYQWTQVSGPSIAFADTASASLTFITPEVSEDSAAELMLTVTDNDGAQSSDTMNLTIENKNLSPQVDAGNDQVVAENTNFTVTGTASDPDGDIASYSWSQLSGPTINLGDANTATLALMAPEVTVDTVAELQLTATDNDGDSSTDSLLVTIENVNKQPTVTAPSTLTVDENTPVELTASATDIDGSISQVAWTQVSGQPVTISNSDSLSASFTAPNVAATTELTFQVTVTDNENATAETSVAVQVVNVPLLINQISSSFGVEGDEITLTSDAVLDSEGTVVLANTVISGTVSERQITVTLPVGVKSGPIRIQSGDEESNALWFTVSENGLITHSEDNIIVGDDGVENITDYLIVAVSDENDNLENAQRLASLVAGEVVGRVDDMNWWQISVDVNNLDELEQFENTLLADATTTSVFVDTISEEDTIDWSQDPDLGEQRSRNNVEEGAQLYEESVSLTEDGKKLPFFMAIGVSERGIDFGLSDFSEYAENASSANNGITIFSENHSSSEGDRPPGSHGSNVVGIIAGEIGDAGNAGLLSALSSSHSGAAIVVNSSNGRATIGSRFATTLAMLENGAKVINWSWGIHRGIGTDTNSDGDISRTEITAGAMQCNGQFTDNNIRNQRLFNGYNAQLTRFFETLGSKYPSAVIVTSAGNGSTDAGDTDNRIPSAFESDQLIVVGAHSSGGNISSTVTEDAFHADSSRTLGDGTNLPGCFGGADTVTVKRAYYSNYGERVDITASGTIVGFQNSTEAGTWGTSYATPIVTATVALMQSINPALTPKQIKEHIRASALPIFNEVDLASGSSVVTRALTADESASNAGSGARLNVQGAIQSALDSVDSSTLSTGPRETVTIGTSDAEVVRRVEVTIPAAGEVFDKVDVVFLVDVSSSYDDDISTFRSQASELFAAFRSSGNDVHIGITSFSDFPVSPYGSSSDYAYRLDQPLTDDLTLLNTTINSLEILNGSDIPESQLEALFQSSRANVGWRDGALPVMFLATDARFHNSDTDSNYPGTGYTATLAALEARKVSVFGLQSGGSISDVIEITDATGGAAFNLSRNSSEIVAAVLSALDQTEQDLSIKLEAVGDFGDTVQSIIPVGVSDAQSGDPITGVNAGDTVSFDVTFSKGNFSASGTVTVAFRLLVNADDVATIQEIPVVLTISN